MKRYEWVSRGMYGRLLLIIDESDEDKDYFKSFAIITSALINEQTPMGPLIPWAN